MRDATLERYKEVLKAGHVAVLQDHPEVALEHYREAAALATARATPHTSAGGVLLLLGRVNEALAEYAKALGRAPHDEAALSGRAEALMAADRRREAAEVLDRLAEIQQASGRQPEAAATVARAFRLGETRRRRKWLAMLEAQFAVDAPPTGASAGDAPRAEARTVDAPASEPPLIVAGASTEGVRGDPTPAVPEPVDPPQVVSQDLAPAPDPTKAEDRAAAAEPAKAVARAAAMIELPAPDPEAFYEDAEEARAAGRQREAIALFVLASDAYARSRATDAALEMCQRALEVAPETPAIHLALARLYLGRGWGERATDKLILLDRLLTLDPAPAARRELAALAAAHAAGDPRLAQLATAPGPTVLASVAPSTGSPSPVA